ncbi:MAG TPA: peptide-N(4)-(N-acetyl-beta-glucosaminyl)asparagine amidase, partial [Rhodanobacteraceae bacterium]|nr:peptide-N(4)-(N-acetyl-beta-glucosaminyl)asparagine amidase [Rhodanobacteraceae bacterium]
MLLAGARIRMAVLAALIASPFAYAQLPPIGSENVAVADPEIPPPPTDPCVVPLFDDLTFIGFEPQLFDFAPPDACPGPWQKVVFSADF